MTRKFDKIILKSMLESMSKEHSSAFSAACAQRLMPCFLEFCKKTEDLERKYTAIRVFDWLWSCILENDDNHGIELKFEELKGIEVNEEEALDANTPYAADAYAAVFYSFEMMRSGDYKFAIWSAQRLYEVLDDFVGNNFFSEVNIIDEEYTQKIIEHPLVQNELLRQESDLNILRDGSIKSIIKLKKKSELDSINIFKY